MLTIDQLYVLNLLRRSFDLPCDDKKPESVQNVIEAILKNGIILTVFFESTFCRKGQNIFVGKCNYIL